MKEAIHLMVHLMQYLERTGRKELAEELCNEIVVNYIGEDNFRALEAEMAE